MIHSSLALLGAALVAASPGAPAAARRVAVLDFNARWAPRCATARTDAEQEKCEVLRLFADQARAGALAVLRPPAYVVMTRENTAQILKDMGGVCSEGECEVETARLLGASVVVSGEVALLEGTYIVSLKVHDVASAALLGTASTQAKTKLEAFGNVRAETERMLKEAVGLDGTGAVAVAAAPVKPPPPAARKPEPEPARTVPAARETAAPVVRADVEPAPRAVAPPGAGQAPASPPPAGVRSARGRWWVEAGPVMSLGFEMPQNTWYGDTSSDFGAIIRAGYRKTDQWGFEAVVVRVGAWKELVPGGNRSDLNLKSDCFGVGVSWAPWGNRYFSLGADAGIAAWKYSVDGSDTDTSGPFGLGEVRLDYPFGSFAVGARLGILLTQGGGADLSSSDGTELRVEKGTVQFMPASIVAQYRF